MLVSKNFTLNELIKSDVATRNGIDNSPSKEAVQNLTKLCENVLQPLRDNLNRPIKITSGYRSPDLNTLIGGSTHSQHCFGQAADIEVDILSTVALAFYVKNNVPSFDQLILEFYDPKKGESSGWVHVSYVSLDRNRKQFLSASRDLYGNIQYKEFLNV